MKQILPYLALIIALCDATFASGQKPNILIILADDPSESKNLAQAQPERVNQLAAAWDRWNEGNIDPAWFPEVRGAAKKAAPATKAKEKEKSSPLKNPK